jgi:hypothetical protein
VEPWDTDQRGLGTGGHTVVKPLDRALLDRFQAIKHRFGKDTANGGVSGASSFSINGLKAKKGSPVVENVIKITKFVAISLILYIAETAYK